MHMQGYLFEPDIYVKLFFYFSTKKKAVFFLTNLVVYLKYICYHNRIERYVSCIVMELFNMTFKSWSKISLPCQLNLEHYHESEECSDSPVEFLFLALFFIRFFTPFLAAGNLSRTVEPALTELRVTRRFTRSWNLKRMKHETHRNYRKIYT